MIAKRTLTLSCTIAVAAGVYPSFAQVQKRPNILIIIADDCSYYDIGCFGSQNHRTPNIDALANEGMLFTNAFNSVTTSVPTRHCLYTGRYPINNGGYANLGMIRDGIKTMPTYMSELGYRVGLAGKWHIWPTKSYPFEAVPGFPVSCVTKNPEHTMEGVTAFIARNPNEPFCLVVASTNPHMPWTGGDPSIYNPDELKLPPILADTPATRSNYAAYLAEIDLLDQEVGDVINALKEQKLYDNTLIFFLTEQGSQLTGAKWTTWTPGVHVGILAKWMGHITPGTRTDAIVQYEDILPTIIASAGGKADKELDGRNLIPLLEGKKNTHRKYAFHLHSNIPSGPAYSIRAVSDGRYRLIWNITYENTYKAKNHDGANWFKEWKQADDPHAQFLVNRWFHRPEFELYDTEADPFELNNLALDNSYHKIKNRLYKALKGWMKQQKDPGAAADFEKPTGPAKEAAEKNRITKSEIMSNT